jgi:hypothetical protein
MKTALPFAITRAGHSKEVADYVGKYRKFGLVRVLATGAAEICQPYDSSLIIMSSYSSVVAARSHEKLVVLVPANTLCSVNAGDGVVVVLLGRVTMPKAARDLPDFQPEIIIGPGASLEYEQDAPAFAGKVEVLSLKLPNIQDGKTWLAYCNPASVSLYTPPQFASLSKVEPGCLLRFRQGFDSTNSLLQPGVVGIVDKGATLGAGPGSIPLARKGSTLFADPGASTILVEDGALVPSQGKGASSLLLSAYESWKRDAWSRLSPDLPRAAFVLTSRRKTFEPGHHRVRLLPPGQETVPSTQPGEILVRLDDFLVHSVKESVETEVVEPASNLTELHSASEQSAREEESEFDTVKADNATNLEQRASIEMDDDSDDFDDQSEFERVQPVRTRSRSKAKRIQNGEKVVLGEGDVSPHYMIFGELLLNPGYSGIVQIDYAGKCVVSPRQDARTTLAEAAGLLDVRPGGTCLFQAGSAYGGRCEISSRLHNPAVSKSKIFSARLRSGCLEGLSESSNEVRLAVLPYYCGRAIFAKDAEPPARGLDIAAGSFITWDIQAWQYVFTAGPAVIVNAGPGSCVSAGPFSVVLARNGSKIYRHPDSIVLRERDAQVVTENESDSAPVEIAHKGAVDHEFFAVRLMISRGSSAPLAIGKGVYPVDRMDSDNGRLKITMPGGLTSDLPVTEHELNLCLHGRPLTKAATRSHYSQVRTGIAEIKPEGIAAAGAVAREPDEDATSEIGVKQAEGLDVSEVAAREMEDFQVPKVAAKEMEDFQVPKVAAKGSTELDAAVLRSTQSKVLSLRQIVPRAVYAITAAVEVSLIEEPLSSEVGLVSLATSSLLAEPGSGESTINWQTAVDASLRRPRFFKASKSTPSGNPVKQ